jgi:hypothetical protein
MSNITTIDLGTLATVFGGAETKGGVDLKVDPKGVGVSANGSQSQSERNQCIASNKRLICPTNWSGQSTNPKECVADLNALCGSPGNGAN